MPSSKAMRDELMKAGFSLYTINQMGVAILYRGLVAEEKKPGLIEQMGSLKCDADSQDPMGAIEDLRDL